MILLITDLFHPVGGLAFKLFHKGDMRHTLRSRGSMPVFLTRRDPDHIALPDFLDWPPPFLNLAQAGRHDQCLTERVAVPGRPGTGLERDAGAGPA